MCPSHKANLLQAKPSCVSGHSTTGRNGPGSVHPVPSPLPCYAVLFSDNS